MNLSGALSKIELYFVLVFCSIEKYMQEKELTIITKLAKAEHDILALWIYGSRAKGNAHHGSDYDLAVLFMDADLDPLARRTRPECLALDWAHTLGFESHQLSVLDIEISPIPLAMAVLTTGRQLFSRKSSKELFITQKIMSKWELDYQYHYKHYG